MSEINTIVWPCDEKMWMMDAGRVKRSSLEQTAVDGNKHYWARTIVGRLDPEHHRSRSVVKSEHTGRVTV